MKESMVRSDQALRYLSRILDLWEGLRRDVIVRPEGVREDVDQAPDREDDEQADESPEDVHASGLARSLIGSSDDEIADDVKDDIDHRECDQYLDERVAEVSELVGEVVDASDRLSGNGDWSKSENESQDFFHNNDNVCL